MISLSSPKHGAPTPIAKIKQTTTSFPKKGGTKSPSCYVNEDRDPNYNC